MRVGTTLWRAALLACACVGLTSASVEAQAPTQNNCFAFPIVIISPTVKPFPTKGCKQAPEPSENCLKTPTEAVFEVVDNRDANGVAQINCVDNTPTSVHPATANYRGQSSLGFEKHQYSVHLHTAAEFLGFPEDKSFVLNGPHIDGSLVRNHLAQWLFRSTGRYSPRTRHIIVYVRDLTTKNLKYMGVYLGLEKISYGPNRVGLAKLDNKCKANELNGGWAWQLNPLNYGVYSPNVIVDEFQLMFGSGSRPVLMYPKPEDMTQTMRDYFVEPTTGPLPQMYRYLYNNMTQLDDLEKVIDLGSFVDYMLHSELSQNTDAYRRSTYFFKDRDQPISAGPVWDFNLAFGTGSNQPDWLFKNHFLWKRMLLNYKYASLTIKRWRQLRETVWSDATIESFIDNATAPLKLQFENCTEWNSDQIPCANVNVGGTFQANIDRVKTAIHGRAKWIDENVIKFYAKADLMPWGPAIKVPTYNCGPDGEDYGCLTNPEKYLAAVEIPPVRKPNQAPACNATGPLEPTSIDPCWLSSGSGTRFCSGNGYCPMGPGAKCSCVNGKAPPTCDSSPYEALTSAEAATQSTNPEHSVQMWGNTVYLLVLMCGVFGALLVANGRRRQGYTAVNERTPIVARPHN